MTSSGQTAGRRNWKIAGALGAIVILLIAGLVALRVWSDSTNNAARPRLGLVTSLPLVWGEGALDAVVRGESAPAPAFLELQRHFTVIAIDDVGSLAAADPDVLLLAQPGRLRPVELVALDGWLRAGGRALFLADPALQWDTGLPLGDSRRPAFTSLLSPLFSHWGIELALPMDDAVKVREVTIGEDHLMLAVPGVFQLIETSPADTAGDCTIAASGLTFACKLDRGRAEGLADADLLAVEYWRESSPIGAVFGASSDNMSYVVRRLQTLAAERMTERERGLRTNQE